MHPILFGIVAAAVALSVLGLLVFVVESCISFIADRLGDGWAISFLIFIAFSVIFSLLAWNFGRDETVPDEIVVPVSSLSCRE